VTILDPPSGLAERGRLFWSAIAGRYELAVDEVELLTEVCRSLDLADRLADDPAANPRTLLLVRAYLGRSLAQLRIPDGLDSPATARARTAGAARWAADTGDQTSSRAQRAAMARWHPARDDA
jgi:hypothetical protein